MRNRFNMKTQTAEGMADYYLEKMLSDSAQFRAYNEVHQQRQETRRAEQVQERLEEQGRLRQMQRASKENPVVHALVTLFNFKKSA